MTKIVLVIAVASYSFTDETTKRLNEGCTVRYVMTEDLSPTEDSDKKTKGYKPAKATLPIEKYRDFREVPAYYEATLDVNVDSAGNAKITPKDFVFKNSMATPFASGKVKLSV